MIFYVYTICMNAYFTITLFLYDRNNATYVIP